MATDNERAKTGDPDDRGGFSEEEWELMCLYCDPHYDLDHDHRYGRRYSYLLEKHGHILDDCDPPTPKVVPQDRPDEDEREFLRLFEEGDTSWTEQTRARYWKLWAQYKRLVGEE